MTPSQNHRRQKSRDDHPLAMSSSCSSSLITKTQTSDEGHHQQKSMCELGEMMQMKLEIAELRTSLGDAKHVASQYREENHRLRSRLIETTEDRDMIKARLSKFKSKMIQMKSMIDTLKRSRTEMRVRLEAAESQAIESRNRSRQLMQSNENLMDERDMLSGMVNENQRNARRRSVGSHRRGSILSFGSISLPFSQSSMPLDLQQESNSTIDTSTIPPYPETVTTGFTTPTPTPTPNNNVNGTTVRRGRRRSSMMESLDDGRSQDGGVGDMSRHFSEVSLGLDSVSELDLANYATAEDSAADLAVPPSTLQRNPTTISSSYSTNLSPRPQTQSKSQEAAPKRSSNPQSVPTHRSSSIQSAPNNVSSRKCILNNIELHGSLQLGDIAVLTRGEGAVRDFVEESHNTLTDVNNFMKSHAQSNAEFYDEVDGQEAAPALAAHQAPRKHLDQVINRRASYCGSTPTGTHSSEPEPDHSREQSKRMRRRPSAASIVLDRVLDGLLQERVGEETQKEDDLGSSGGSYSLSRYPRRNSLNAAKA